MAGWAGISIYQILIWLIIVQMVLHTPLWYVTLWLILHKNMVSHKWLTFLPEDTLFLMCSLPGKRYHFLKKVIICFLIGNNGPLSLTYICSKLLENIGYLHIYFHFTKYNLLCDQQMGLDMAAYVRLSYYWQSMALPKALTTVIKLTSYYKKVSHEHLTPPLWYTR